MTFYVLIAFLAPFISPHNPYAISSDTLLSPRFEFLMGTDDLGRDIFSGVLHGTRASLLVGVTTAVSATLIGMFLGLLSGYYGGIIDNVLMRFTELFIIIPRFVLALVIVSLVGSSLPNLIIVLTIGAWPSTARLVRAETLSTKEREFVEASRVIGDNALSIMFREILPNVLSSVIVNASIQTATAILLEAGLSFLGLGDANIISWGLMLQRANMFLTQAWWMSFFPGLAILIAVLSINQIGDGLNDALNPKLKE